ncbi:MAG: peptide deformylase [Bacillales bacterium]|nr:peptide deformylase [Bacillales bacterium]
MILVKDIITDDHPTLRKIADEVKTPVSKKDLKALKDMMVYLERSQDEDLCDKYDLKPGVGLAAPQINLSKRMLAILAPDENGIDKEYGIINPVILGESVQMTYLDGGEGCLSLPGQSGTVPRHKKVKFRALFYNYKDKTLEERTETFIGYLAIVFQHEFDHINGILFTDKVKEDLKDIVPLSQIDKKDE